MDRPRPLLSPNGAYKSVRVNAGLTSPGENLNGSFSRADSVSTTSSPGAVTKFTVPSIKPTAHQAMKKEIRQPMIKVITDPNQMPTASVLSMTIPPRDFQQPPHKYAGTTSSGGLRRVDSRSESKMSDSRPYSEAPLEFVGASYTNMPNAHRVNYQSPPRNPTLPRPFAPLVASDYANAPMLSNRTASGRILGAAAQRVIAPNRVPVVPVEEPVGPDNPYQAINDTWTKCWDNEAGAVYYYNNVTGEATWLQPDL